ncbi:FecR family protein [Pedobacter gandavensis]|uniref:FecR family protein n=1 Tax=Pedobacter gandavensis TaxID=2679963 RepID=UPI00292F4115|nr:FecR domain-containing protein [Pedobacter gandavensis]
MEEKQELAHLYQLYLNNRCTTEELNRFFILINKGKEEENLVQLLSATWDQTPMSPETGLLPYFLPQVQQQQTAAHANSHTAVPNIELLEVPLQKSYPMFRYISAIAAMLLIFCGIYFYRTELWSAIETRPNLEIASVSNSRRQFQLSDGTKIWLSPHSKLTYPATFKGNQRLVNLDGEAFFEVAHDASHPFIIKTGKVSTRVLGTSFSLSAYPSEEDVNVTLLSGKVAVSFDAAGKTTEAMITANQRVSVNKNKQTISTINFPDAKDFLDRRLGLFDYKGTPLSEVIEDLEMQYQVKIKLSPELQKHRFYGHLNMNSPLAQNLQKLCTVMETNWKEDGGQYVITK